MQLCFLLVGMLAAKFNFQLSAHFHPAGHHRIISCFCTWAERDRKKLRKNREIRYESEMDFHGSCPLLYSTIWLCLVAFATYEYISLATAFKGTFCKCLTSFDFDETLVIVRLKTVPLWFQFWILEEKKRQWAMRTLLETFFRSVLLARPKPKTMLVFFFFLTSIFILIFAPFMYI